MKCLGIMSLCLSVIVFAFQSPVVAQDCEIDLSQIINTLQQANISAANGDQDTALTAIMAVRLALENIETACRSSIDNSSVTAAPNALPQEYVMEQGAYYRVNYPEGWQVRQRNNFLFFSDSVDELNTAVIPPTGGVLALFIVKTYAEAMGDLPLLPEYSLHTVAQYYLSLFQPSSSDPNPEIVEFTTPRYNAVSFEVSGDTADALTVVVDLGAYMGHIQVTTAPGELEHWKPTIIAMIDSIEHPSS